MTSLLIRNADLSIDAPPVPTRAQSHHLANVLRLKPGAPLRILNGAGSSRIAEITEISKTQTVVKYDGGVTTLPRPAAEITLFQCVAKAARMDWLIEKATELAVARIVPVISERTIGGAAHERWERIAESALCQCGGGWLPEIAPAAKWNDVLVQIRSFRGTVFTAALTPEAQPLGAELSFFHPNPSAFLIGPEGDLTPAEYESAFAAGARPVSFGPQVLRVETAAIFAVCATRAFDLRARR